MLPFFGAERIDAIDKAKKRRGVSRGAFSIPIV